MAQPEHTGMRRNLLPAWVTVRATFPAYRATLLAMVVTSGLAVLLETAGFGLIYLLIVNLTGSAASANPLVLWVNAVLGSPLVLTLASVALLSLGVRLKYHVIRRTSEVSYLAGKYAGALAVNTARPLVRDSQLADAPPRYLRTVLNTLLREIPFACGFTAGGLSLMIVHAIQACLLGLILLYLSPLLTLALVVVAVIAIRLLSNPFGAVVEVTEKRKINTAGIRRELDELGALMTAGDASAPQFAARVEQAIGGGRAHDHLNLRLAQRRLLQTGPLVMEYVYPAAIILISLMYIYGGEMAPHISRVALYFLLFRQFAVACSVIANVLMSASRHQLQLTTFMNLTVSRQLPDPRQDSNETDFDE